MKKIIIAFMGIFFFSQCEGQTVKSNTYAIMLKGLLSHSVSEISVDSLAKVKSDVILLDAREQKEFDVSHIEGAKYVGYDNFKSEAVSDLDKTKPVVVYCSVGYRSEKISEKLLKMGFTDVSNLYGGIFEWKNNGYSVENADGETEKVHAFDKIWGVWLKKGEKVYN
jgi:rhodanese-related sulfurtransferase